MREHSAGWDQPAAGASWVPARSWVLAAVMPTHAQPAQTTMQTAGAVDSMPRSRKWAWPALMCGLASLIAVAIAVPLALAASRGRGSAGSTASAASKTTGADNMTRTCVDTSSCSLAEYLRGPSADVLIMRHALAPGGGDPDGFDLTECTTQRNLNAEGRQQATDIGEALAKAFKASGVSMRQTIYSSQW